MEQMPQNTFEDNDNQRSLSRRELIKIIGAAGFAVTATALIPDRWLPPQIDIGVLPVHAQTSEALTISNVSFTPLSPPCYNGTMRYSDPLRQTGINSSRVHVWTLANFPVEAQIINIIPQLALTGTVTFIPCTDDEVGGLCAQLNTMGRLSNVLCQEFDV